MVSGNLEHAFFTRTEMERRYARARELMGQRGIDALLITGEENFQYFVGTSGSIGLHHSLSRPSVFVLPMDNEPIVLTQGMEHIKLGCYVKDIREYFDVLQFPINVAVEALEDAGLKNKRVGAELGQEQRMGIPTGSYNELVEAMSHVEFVDAADIIVKLRMVKSSEELVYIRKAADITARARQRMYDSHIVRGMTERDVVRTIRRLILEEGGDRTSFVHLQHNLPGAKNQFPYDRPLTEGMILGVDTGAYYRQYTVDYPRFAVLGKATAEIRWLHETVKGINKAMADALRPGIKCSEIHRIGAKAMGEAKATPVSPGKLDGGSRMGHGQGMLFTEPPSITPFDHTVLEVGMVLSTEPGIRSGDVHMGSWEDVHVITEDGHEQITLERDDLRELPF